MSDVWDAAAASAAAAAAAASTSPTASLTNTTTETLDSSYTTTTTTGGDCIHHHHHRALTHNSPPMSAALTTTTNIPSTGSSPALLSASASAPALAPTPLLMPSFKLSKRNQVKKACVNCQKACKKCDDCRPCGRCHRLGIQASCADSARKERTKSAAGRPKRGPWAYISPATDDRSSSSEFIQSRSSVAPLETGTTSTPTPTAAAASQSDTIMGTDCIYPPTLASQTDRLATPRLVPPPSSVVSQAMELDLSQDLYAHNNIVGFNTSTNMDDKYSDPVRPAHVPVPLLQDSNGGHMDHSRHKLPALTLYEYNPPLTVHHPKGVSEMQRLHHAHPASHILSKQPFPLLPLPLLKKSFMEPPNCHTDTSQHVHIPTHFIQPSVQRPIPTSFDQAFPHRPIPSHDFGRFRTTSVVSTFSSTPDTDDNDVGDRVEEEAVWIGSNRDDSSALCRSGNESVVDRSPLCEIELEASSFSLTKLDILSRLCDVVLADPRSVESPLLVPLLPHSGRTPISTQQHSALPPCHGSYSNSTAHDFEHSWVPNVHSVKPSYAELRPLYTEVVQHDTTKSLEKLHPCSTTPPATPISAGTTGASLPYILNVVTAESSDVSYPRPVLTWDTENHHQYLNAATTV